MGCTCGHEPELHKEEVGACSGRLYQSGYPAPETAEDTFDCECILYEEDDDELA